MGNCFCCQSKGHCDSAEETSLLQNDSKAAAVAPAETPVVGTCGPGIEEDISKEALNKEAETESYSAQENGTLQKNSLQTEAPSSKSPHHQENKDNAQDVDIKATAADTEDAGHQQSTLNPQHTGRAHADWEVSKATPEEEEKPAEDKSLNETAVCTKAPSLIETQPKQEHIIMDSINNNSEDAGGSGQVTLDKSKDEPLIETATEQKGEELPNTQPAAPVCQVLPITEIKEEVANAEVPSSVNKDDPENRSFPVCVEAKPEETQSHEVPESSLGSESTPDHSFVPEPDTTSTADVCKSSKQVEKSDSDCTKDATTEESQKDVQPEEQVKEKDDVHGEKKVDTFEEAAESASEGVPEIEEAIVVKEVHLVESSSPIAQGDTGAGETVATNDGNVEDVENSEEDLYRGAEELSPSATTTSGAPSLSETLFVAEDRCSLAPAVDILSYSEREWRGNTTKSALIRKGYKEMTQRFSSLRRVRGDNYCALRGTLYQILSQTTQMPEWLQEESITMLPKDLETREELISQWIFPGECLLQGDRDATQQLTGYMELLRNKWQAAVDCVSPAERQQMCEQLFQGGEEELGLLEALKLLMLARAVELHGCIQRGEDTPLFCWLLFARDSSDCPRSFLNNHLSHVGLSAGLEQVEMFLLGYALQCTIQVYRLYKADTEEFVTFYPDDHKDDWPCVCLVTEDDRHYNVPVLEAADLPQELKSS